MVEMLTASQKLEFALTAWELWLQEASESHVSASLSRQAWNMYS